MVCLFSLYIYADVSFKYLAPPLMLVFHSQDRHPASKTSCFSNYTLQNSQADHCDFMFWKILDKYGWLNKTWMLMVAFPCMTDARTSVLVVRSSSVLECAFWCSVHLQIEIICCTCDIQNIKLSSFTFLLQYYSQWWCQNVSIFNTTPLIAYLP